MHVIKAHAYGNDFLFATADDCRSVDLPQLARTICERHTGLGADGLIVYQLEPGGASMRLFNADGSPAEVSGNGVRCLAAILTEARGAVDELIIRTEGGTKRLRLLDVREGRYLFRASMGVPQDLRLLDLEAAGETVRAAALWMGNPQCVLLGPLVDEPRFRRLGPALERHPAFPEGTNVEFAEVETPNRVRILVWERGVGPTTSSGTGSCAAAVAAMTYGGADRDVEVVAPGGVQRVEWRTQEVFLTGWAQIVLEGRWRG